MTRSIIASSLVVGLAALAACKPLIPRQDEPTTTAASDEAEPTDILEDVDEFYKIANITYVSRT